MPRRNFLGLVAAGLAATALAPMLRGAPAGPPPKPQNVLTPDQALARLLAGNHRYVDGTTRRDDFAATRAALAAGQAHCRIGRTRIPARGVRDPVRRKHSWEVPCDRSAAARCRVR